MCVVASNYLVAKFELNLLLILRNIQIMVTNGSVHKTLTWIGGTSASSGNGGTLTAGE